MKLLIFATEKEAEQSLKRLPPDCKIVISGIGSLNALAAVLKHGETAEEIYNVGICGALGPTLTLGTVVTVSQVSKYTALPDDEIVKLHLPTFSYDYGTLRLLTSDAPIHDHELKNELAKQWDLVDMEGYGIAYGAHKLGKKVTLIKLVSDFASEGGRELIARNMSVYSEIFAKSVIPHLLSDA